MDIKQTDMPPAEAAKKTKEFRCPPKEQMFRLLNCKTRELGRLMLDEDVEFDQCPLSETLQEQLREYCTILVERIGCTQSGDGGDGGGGSGSGGDGDSLSSATKRLALTSGGGDEEAQSWVDQLAHMVIKVPPAPTAIDTSTLRRGTQNFKRMVVETLKRWASESEIESNELIRKMFKLLLRQYTGVKELMDALAQTYVLHERNVADVEVFIVYLMQIRELLHVQFETDEEALLKRGLWQLMNNRIFFQHPDLMRLLRVHEDVMRIMVRRRRCHHRRL